MLETVGEGIITIDSSSTIVMVNQEVQNIWGYRQEDLTGKKLHILMPEKYHELHSAGMQRYLKTRIAHVLGKRFELEGLKKDGTTFPLEIRIKQTQIEERLFFTAAVRDITDRVRVEEELLRHREELAHVSRVDTMAELATLLAHELNQPLTAILTNAQATLRLLDGSEADAKEAREALEDIVDDARRAGEMIRR